MFSLNKVNNIYYKLFLSENLVLERTLLFFVVDDSFSFIINNLDVKEVRNNGISTAFIFNNFFNVSKKYPQFFSENNDFFYSFLNLYKFYNIDIFRSSFLFFENVRHSTKLEIV